MRWRCYRGQRLWKLLLLVSLNQAQALRGLLRPNPASDSGARLLCNQSFASSVSFGRLAVWPNVAFGRVLAPKKVKRKNIFLTL